MLMKLSTKLTKLAKALVLAADFPIFGLAYNLLRGKLLEKSDKPGKVLPEHVDLAAALYSAFSDGNEGALADLYFKNQDIFDPMPRPFEKILLRWENFREVLEVPPIIEEYDPRVLKVIEEQADILFKEIRDILYKKSEVLGMLPGTGIHPTLREFDNRAIEAKNNKDLVNSLQELHNIFKELKEV